MPQFLKKHLHFFDSAISPPHLLSHTHRQKIGFVGRLLDLFFFVLRIDSISPPGTRKTCTHINIPRFDAYFGMIPYIYLLLYVVMGEDM